LDVTSYSQKSLFVITVIVNCMEARQTILLVQGSEPIPDEHMDELLDPYTLLESIYFMPPFDDAGVRASQDEVKKPEAALDSEWSSWLQVALSFTIQFMVLGNVNAFGVWAEAYVGLFPGTFSPRLYFI
jgi:hypothetical protein